MFKYNRLVILKIFVWLYLQVDLKFHSRGGVAGNLAPTYKVCCKAITLCLIIAIFSIFIYFYFYILYILLYIFYIFFSQIPQL